MAVPTGPHRDALPLCPPTFSFYRKESLCRKKMRKQSVRFSFLASWMPTNGPESWYTPSQDKICQVCIHLRFAKHCYFPQYRHSLRKFSEQIAEVAQGPEVAHVSGLNRSNQGLGKFRVAVIVIAVPSFIHWDQAVWKSFMSFVASHEEKDEECYTQLLLTGFMLNSLRCHAELFFFFKSVQTLKYSGSYASKFSAKGWAYLCLFLRWCANTTPCLLTITMVRSLTIAQFLLLRTKRLKYDYRSGCWWPPLSIL